MSDGPFPVIAWQAMKQAASNQDYLMVSLCALSLALTPVAWPIVTFAEFAGFCIAKLINSPESGV